MTGETETEQRPQSHEHDTSDDQFIQTTSSASVSNVDFTVITWRRQQFVSSAIDLPLVVAGTAESLLRLDYYLERPYFES